MDPLAHTLVGAALAATRLGRATPLAPAALLLGANAADVDVFAYAWGEDVAMGFRRGWTHGVLALAVLPAVVAGILLVWDRWVRRRRGPGRRPATGGRLLALAALAVATHPVLDWLNNYGMRWWMPFDGRWSYGDSVFIVDPWIWLLLGCPLLLTRQPTLAPSRHSRLAIAGLALTALYIASLIAVHAAAEVRVREALLAANRGPVARLMVGPTPLDPFAWDVVAETREGYVHGHFRWLALPQLELAPVPIAPAASSALWPAVRADPSLQGFLRWARFPWIARGQTGSGSRALLLDARYARQPTAGFAGIEVAP